MKTQISKFQKTSLFLPGISLCIFLGVISKGLVIYIPIGGITIAILLGILVGNTLKLEEKWQKGIKFSEKKILSLAIMLLGLQLDFQTLQKLGIKTVILVLATVFLALLLGYFLGKLFKIQGNLPLLLGIGNGICGSAAIAGAGPVMKATEEEIGLSVTIVNFLGTLGIFLLPILAGFVLKISEFKSGILIGGTLQAVGQVSAAGFSINDAVGQTAMIVKMGRILMLGPILIFLSFFYRGKTSKENLSKKKSFPIPLFILGFIFFSLVGTFKVLPAEWMTFLKGACKWALIISMAGIGLKIKIANVLEKGWRFLILGTVIFMSQIFLATSIVLLLF